jgi:4-hydroxy-tetrahydrodipicolinate synthase
VLSGDDNLTLPLISIGGRGVISVVGNLLPKRISDMVSLALSGKIKEARNMHYELMPMLKGAFLETNPLPIKTAMRMSGMPSGGFRLPLCDMSPKNEEKLKEIRSNYSELRTGRSSR